MMPEKNGVMPARTERHVRAGKIEWLGETWQGLWRDERCWDWGIDGKCSWDLCFVKQNTFSNNPAEKRELEVNILHFHLSSTLDAEVGTFLINIFHIGTGYHYTSGNVTVF